jgi:hypothetical protein
MAALVNALDDLDAAVRVRVIDWAANRYGVKVQTARRGGADSAVGAVDDEEQTAPIFKHFSDLLDATQSPSTIAERALIGGYWFQVVQGEGTFTGLQVNNELKNAGHGIGNITDALTTLQSRSPAQVRQVMKSGRTKQARKTYKLTVAGIRAVQTMMGGATGGPADEA